MRSRDWPPLPGGCGFPLGFLAGTGAVTVAVAMGATVHPVLSVALLAVTVAVVSALTVPSAALATAVVCWGLHDGFVLGHRGVLVFTTASAQAAVVLVSIAVITSLVMAVVRKVDLRRALSTRPSIVDKRNPSPPSVTREDRKVPR
ncbi:hypothetical protein [Amycolatopsis pigmentata]|uniref:Uncharacterized protein n=1 Tax=Amycolatopsis pigmentata TaxID=450801 RepID=A0ABW5FRA0_9PSEU